MKQGDSARRSPGEALVPALVVLALAACSVAAALPLLRHEWLAGQDGFEHVFRILDVETSLLQGNVWPRWSAYLAGGFGDPLFTVYSPLAYYLPAVLAMLGANIFSALRYQLIALCVANVVGLYLALRQRLGHSGALVAAATFGCAPYTLADAAVRFDLAELSSFPLAVWTLGGLLALERALKQVAELPYDHWVKVLTRRPVAPALAWTAIPAALLPLTHSLSALTFFPLLAVVALVMWWGSPRIGVAALACVAVLTVGLAAWFVLPALQWQGWLQLADIGGDPNFLDKLLHVPSILTHWTSIRSWEWFGPQGAWWTLSVAPSALGELPAGPPYVGLAVATLGIGPLVVRRPSQRGLALALVLAALASAWLMTAWAAPFWQAMPRLTQLQFPWRLAGGLTLAVAVLAGLAVSQLPARLRPLAALVCIVLAVVPAVLLVQPPMRAFDASATTWPDQVRRELVGGFGTTGNALFLPRWVRTGALSTVTEGASGLSATSLTAQVVSLDQESMTLRYQAAAPTLLTVGQVYVPVWMATVDGTRVPVQPEAQNGLQQVLLPAGAHELRLWLGQTTLGHIAAGVSLLALLAVVWLVVGGRVDPSPAPKGHPSLLPGRGVRFPAVVGALVVVLGVAAGLAWRQQQAAGGWQAPQAPSASPLQVASWRLEPLPVWGSAPVVDVVWLSGGPVTADDDVVVRLQQGAVTAERQQRPRLGALGENSWAADVLVSDHVQLPVVANVCGGNYALSLGVTMHGSGVPAVFQDLGIVSLPERPGCQPLAATVSSGPVASFQVTQLTPAAAPGVLTSLVPGTAITLSADVQKLRFTSSDAVFDARLIDSKGAVAAERLSSPNLDLWLTSLWRPGEHRPVQLTLLLPASMQVGVYHLTLGLHVPGSGRFEPVQLAGGPVVNGLAELATYVVPPPRVVPPSTAPVLASFGGDIGLESVTLQGATAGTWKAGAPLLVDLRWRCLVATHTEYTLTVQVLDASGKLVAQADAPPLDGRFPTSVWAVGDVVSETHTVPLPATLPAGTYRLMLAWYASSGGARLPVRPVAPDQMFGAGTITVSQ